MQVLLSRVGDPAIQGRILQGVFCAIWIGLAGLFASLAMTASASRHAGLPRAGFRVPSRPNVQVGNLRIQEVINSLAEKYDQSVSQLEETVRRSARTQFWLGVMGAVLSLAGLGNQGLSAWIFWHHSERGAPRLNRKPARTVPARGNREWPVEISHLKDHDGSFPDSGYGR
jgi:hypothetical protein